MAGQPQASPDAAAKEITVLHLPALQKVLFSSMKLLPSVVEAYAVPTEEGSLPGIDALHPSSGRMFRCTVSQEHDLGAGVFALLEQLDSSVRPAIYVVVPTQAAFAAWTHEMTVPKLPEPASDEVMQHRTILSNTFCCLRISTDSSNRTCCR